MPFRYSTQYTHLPAPIIFDVKAFNPFNNTSSQFDCWIDSGAEMTCVPLNIITKMNLYPCDEIGVTGYDGSIVNKVKIYQLKLTIIGKKYDVVVISSASKHGLIGLDILNQLKLTLDGINQQFEIQ